MKTVEEINKAAIGLELPPKDYSLLEMHLFIVLKDIYKQYFNGRIDKEIGANLKRYAVAEYDKRFRQYKLELDLRNIYLSSIRKTESLRRKLRLEIKNKDRNALNTAIQLISLYSGEFSTWEEVDVNEFK